MFARSASRLLLMVFWGLVQGAVLVPNIAWASVVISIPDTATVWGERIWLTELAKVDGEGPAVASTQRALSRISLGPSPRPGESRTISKAVIEGRILQATHNDGGLELNIPDKVLVSRAANFLEDAEIEAALKQYIRRAFALPEAEIDIHNLKLAAPLAAPVGEHSIRFQEVGNRPPLGDTTVTAVVMQGRSVVAQGKVSADVQISTPVVILNHTLARGRVIKADDLEMAVVSVGRLQGAPFFSLDEVEGLLSKRALSEGAILTERDVVLPPAVANGDLVTIVVRSPGVTLSAPGQAKADGQVGDVIAVFSEATNKLLRARVLTDGLVEVLYRPAASISHGSP